MVPPPSRVLSTQTENNSQTIRNVPTTEIILSTVYVLWTLWASLPLKEKGEEDEHLDYRPERRHTDQIERGLGFRVY